MLALPSSCAKYIIPRAQKIHSREPSPRLEPFSSLEHHRPEHRRYEPNEHPNQLDPEEYCWDQDDDQHDDLARFERSMLTHMLYLQPPNDQEGWRSNQDQCQEKPEQQGGLFARISCPSHEA
jgi:hypothetical protein